MTWNIVVGSDNAGFGCKRELKRVLEGSIPVSHVHGIGLADGGEPCPGVAGDHAEETEGICSPDGSLEQSRLTSRRTRGGEVS